MAPTTPVSDANDYRKHVLAAAAASNEIPDLFARYGLALQAADSDLITRQLKATLAIWNKETGHPKYGTLVRRLINEHPQATRVLTDPVLRERERQDVSRRAQGDAAKRYRTLDAQLAELVKRHGGIPRSRIADLIQFGAVSGVGEPEVRVRLERERLIDDIGATRQMLTPAKFAEIQHRLAEYRTATGRSHEAVNLFSFIGARFDAQARELQSRYDALDSQNDKRIFGDEKTLVSRVLRDVQLRLLDADPEPYRNSVMREVKDGLLPAIESHKLIDGNITQDALTELERAAVEAGLDAGRAAAAVRELACERRAAIITRPAVPPPPERATPPPPPPPVIGEGHGPPRPSDLLPPRPPPQSVPPGPPPRSDSREQRPPYWPPPQSAPPGPPPRSDTRDQRPPYWPPPIPVGGGEPGVSDGLAFSTVVRDALKDPVKYALLRRQPTVTTEELAIAARVWFAYAFIPLIGPGLAWLTAALLTRGGRTFAWSGFYLGSPVLFIPDTEAVLGWFIILWLAGMAHVSVVRKRVTSQIRNHAWPLADAGGTR